MEEINTILKACISSRHGGMPQDQLDGTNEWTKPLRTKLKLKGTKILLFFADEFFKLTGNYIPYLRLGFNSLYEYLGTIKEIVKKRNLENQLVYVVEDPNADPLGGLNKKLSQLNV